MPKPSSVLENITIEMSKLNIKLPNNVLTYNTFKNYEYSP